MKENAANIVESIIFTAEQPVKRQFLLEVLTQDMRQQEDGKGGESKTTSAPVLDMSQEELDGILEELLKKYQSDQYSFEIREIAEGFQFFTKRSYYAFIKKASLNKNQKRLSRAALETLSIIAYRQPITKAEMEFIRGVNCDYAVQKLLDKQLVSIVGRAEAPGRPLLYATSPFFMQYFGIKDMTDLPKLKEFEELAENHMEQFRQLSSQEQADATQIQQSQGSLLERQPEGEAGLQEKSNGVATEANESVGGPQAGGEGETPESE